MPDTASGFILPDPSTAGEPSEQLRLAWRNEATTTGRCPVCHATLRQANRAERRWLARRYGAGVAFAVFEHAAACPVGDGPVAA